VEIGEESRSKAPEFRFVELILDEASHSFQGCYAGQASAEGHVGLTLDIIVVAARTIPAICQRMQGINTSPALDVRAAARCVA
jgi:hypothetical protein